MKQKITASLLTRTFLNISIKRTILAKITSSSHLDYVALGDSLAAGHSPFGVRKSNNGYTDFIASKLQSSRVLGSFYNFAVSGYTTTDVLTNLPNKLDSIKKAEIITLDAGANDLLPYLSALANNDLSVMTNINDVISNKVPNNIAAIINEVKSVNKNAKIYVMGYYNAFPYLPDYQQEQLCPLITTLNSNIKTIAESCGATYVDTYASMVNNQTTNLPNPMDIHPSTAGYAVIANDFWAEINSDFIKTSK